MRVVPRMVRAMPIAKTLLAGRRILLMQGDAAVAAQSARAIVGAGGVAIGPHATVTEWLAALGDRASDIDAAVIDLQLGGGAAYRGADTLRRSGVPVVFLRSGMGEVPARFRTFPILMKPATDYQLVQTLARLLDPAALIVEARASA